MIDFHKLNVGIQCLTVFRGLLSDPVVQRFSALADELSGDNPDRARAANAYAEFAAALYASTDHFSDYVRDLVLSDENPYILNSCIRDMSKSPMRRSLFNDLKLLQDMSRVTPRDVRTAACLSGPPADGCKTAMPSDVSDVTYKHQSMAASEAEAELLFPAEWDTAEYDFAAMYEERIAQLFTRGYGIFAKYHTFMVNDGQIVPVKYPDGQRLSQLTDYERERDQVIKNTLALLGGEPASNVLLYGDAGTGKSSTIKAIANEYRDRGLRLIEIKKNQLYQIPELLEAISRNPLKFILFIDDLSFSTNDSDFAALKAILEGSVAGKSSNLAVYATSNRRHLVKETLSGREGDEIHLNDTMQELMSLSARFGLVITYSKPNKDVYLNIVRNLAKEYGITTSEEKLFQNAEAFAIRSGGRSPRVAKQFIELVKADIR